MPIKPHSSDWERHFGRQPQRRRGPVGLFVMLTLVLGALAVMVISADFGLGRYQAYTAAQALTATPLWAQYYADQTATALSRTPTAAPTVLPTIKVVTAGNLRSEPRIVPETIVGQVAVGEVATLLESRNVEDQLWYRVRLADAGGREGWVNSTLVAAPAP